MNVYVCVRSVIPKLMYLPLLLWRIDRWRDDSYKNSWRKVEYYFSLNTLSISGLSMLESEVSRKTDTPILNLVIETRSLNGEFPVSSTANSTKATRCDSREDRELRVVLARNIYVDVCVCTHNQKQPARRELCTLRKPSWRGFIDATKACAPTCAWRTMYVCVRVCVRPTTRRGMHAGRLLLPAV